MFVARDDCASPGKVKFAIGSIVMCVLLVAAGFWVEPEIRGFVWLSAVAIAVIAGPRVIVAAQKRVWEFSISEEEVRWGWQGIGYESLRTRDIREIIYYKDAECRIQLVAILADGRSVSMDYCSFTAGVPLGDVLTAFESFGLKPNKRK